MRRKELALWTMSKMIGVSVLGLMWLGVSSLAPPAEAFCGFYVAKADTKLFNKASKVVIARHDNKTVITMANDYQGDPKEFALVVPTPTVLDRDQIHVTKPAVIDHLDAYTAPRLVEYFDHDPCVRYYPMATVRRDTALGNAIGARQDAAALGVTIEAQYTVGEYDILILSAQESSGLVTWLTQNDYKIPDGASPVIGAYLDMGMKFFVAKVNLKAHAKQGATYLSPLQIAFESDNFMLPIRLGAINADGAQELFIFMLTKNGRVETANYQTRKLPSNVDIPLFVKNEFGDFYRAMFDHQVHTDQMRHVYLEYAWDMGWCDPCAADPLSVAELQELGVFLATRDSQSRTQKSGARRLCDAAACALHGGDVSQRFRLSRGRMTGRIFKAAIFSGIRGRASAPSAKKRSGILPTCQNALKRKRRPWRV